MSEPAPPFPLFSACPFSEQSFLAALENEHCSVDQVERKETVRHLVEYLEKYPALGMVIEPEYVDGDYLDDYSLYYVKCFTKYRRFCKRLHFFSCPVSSRDVLDAITSQQKRTRLAENYLGFIVARPLPNAVIGRTVLRPHDDDSANLRCSRRYNVNLCGIELVVNSVAFQEQDSVLAACATVALWSTFHVSNELFRTPLPAPGAITRAASDGFTLARALPSHDLDLLQILSAIRRVGLEPEIMPARPGVPLLSVIRGYLNLGVPPILIVDAMEATEELHAVAVVGYSVNTTRLRDHETGCALPPMLGLRIDSILVHDDQSGPFRRFRTAALGAGTPSKLNELQFVCERKKKTTTHSPKYLVVPVHPKVRLTFTDILKWVTRLDAIFGSALSQTYEWDVTLTATNDLKRALQSSEHLTNVDVIRTLIRPHPRFAWRVVLRDAGKAILELLADATGISRSFPFYEVIWYSPATRKLTADPILQDLFNDKLTSRMRELLYEGNPIAWQGFLD